MRNTSRTRWRFHPTKRASSCAKIGPRPGSTSPWTRSSERNAEISADGRWLAYESTESGREEIYVRPFPIVDAARWQVSTDGGRQPVWSRTGHELFFRAPDASLVEVLVEPSTSGEHRDVFTWSKPATIFQDK